MDLVAAGTGVQVNLTFSDNGQGLFDLLDTNGDGRLSIYEMRTAWKRLEPRMTGWETPSRNPKGSTFG